eukprot:SAG31_NODE_23206_length_509_cov_0.678049_2_plen_53_part_00
MLIYFDLHALSATVVEPSRDVEGVGRAVDEPSRDMDEPKSTEERLLSFSPLE